MTQTPEAATTALIRSLTEIADPVERYETAKKAEQALDRGLKEVKASAALDLHAGRTWKQVGELLRVTGSRAEQISRCSR